MQANTEQGGQKKEILRKPKWIRVKAPVSKSYKETKELISD